MSDASLWWIAAGVLVAAEMVSGTLYLLMVSLGLAAAALAAWAGAASTTQWAVAALVALLTTALWHKVRMGQKARRQGPDPAEQLDLGQHVLVTHWRDDGTCSVKHRGAAWEARLSNGQAPTTGMHAIEAIDGSCLVLRKIV
jgi:membrane protein implicated in regulation of membrane protease activity